MIIKSIEIKNFLSYHGTNYLNFGSGPTIIIGQNRTGKSKLFDAINWAFYDRAYNTDFERWDTTKEWKEQLVNNNAKAQCKKGDSVATSVTISFEDQIGNKFLLTKEYKIKKKSELEWEIQRQATINLSKKDHITNNSTEYWEIEAEELIKSIFPENLSKYFLFQGENISQIMSLNNKSAFTKALRDLSRIEVFEKAKNYTDKVYKQLKKEFESKEDTDKQLQVRKVQLSEELDLLKQHLQEEEENFDNLVKERDASKEVFDKKNEELKKFQECAKILDDIKYLEDQRNSKIEVRSAMVESQKKEIFDTWMYAGTDSLLKNFEKIYNKNKVEKRIPEPIRQEFVKEMIALEECLVCGSDAKKGSEPHKHILGLLNEKALDKETELINKLSFVADSTFKKVQSIKADIKTFYQRTAEIDQQIKTFSDRIRTKEEELRSVIPNDVSEDELKKRNFSVLSRDRDNAKSDLDKYETKITASKSKKDYIERQQLEKQKDYDSLIQNSSNKKERERLLLAERINDSVTEIYDNFLTRLIKDIEAEANSYFEKMTERNSALSGKVKVDYDLKEVYTVNEQGNRQLNINQANKVSLQISFVAAVLSVSNKFWNTYFPFIADAPISALGGNNKVNAVETMIDIFSQSIIILKDDAVTEDPDSVRNDLIRNLVHKNDSIQYAYELTMQGTTLEEQHTKVTLLK